MSLCPDNRGNQFIVSDEPENKYVTYHDWNIEYSGGCNWCGERKSIYRKIKENIYCHCRRCENCGKIIK